jgi:hypothetical protein
MGGSPGNCGSSSSLCFDSRGSGNNITGSTILIAFPFPFSFSSSAFQHSRQMSYSLSPMTFGTQSRTSLQRSHLCPVMFCPVDACEHAHSTASVSHETDSYRFHPPSRISGKARSAVVPPAWSARNHSRISSQSEVKQTPPNEAG